MVHILPQFWCYPEADLAQFPFAFRSLVCFGCTVMALRAFHNYAYSLSQTRCAWPMHEPGTGSVVILSGWPTGQTSFHASVMPYYHAACCCKYTRYFLFRSICKSFIL